MKTIAQERLVSVVAALLFVACAKDPVGENSAANVESSKMSVQGAYEDSANKRHFLFSSGNVVVLDEDGAREKAAVTLGRGKNGPNLRVDAEEGASFLGEFDFLQTGTKQNLLLRDDAGKTVVLNKLASFCAEAEDCNAQGLKACESGKAYACAASACSCKVPPASGSSKDAGPKDSGAVSKDAGSKDSGTKDSGKDAR
jgi:hypothetical protein